MSSSKARAVRSPERCDRRQDQAAMSARAPVNGLPDRSSPVQRIASLLRAIAVDSSSTHSAYGQPKDRSLGEAPSTGPFTAPGPVLYCEALAHQP